MSGKVPPPLKPKPKFAPEVAPKKPELSGSKIHSTSKHEESPEPEELDISSLRNNLKKTGRKLEDLENTSRESTPEESNLENKTSEIQVIRPSSTSVPAVAPRRLPPPFNSKTPSPVVNGIKLPSMDELSTKTSSIDLDKSSAESGYAEDEEMEDIKNNDKPPAISLRTKQQPSLPPKRHKFSNDDDEAMPPSLPSRPRPSAHKSTGPKQKFQTADKDTDDEEEEHEDDLESDDEEDRPPLPQRPGSSKPKLILPSKPKPAPSISSKPVIPEKPVKLDNEVPKRPVPPVRSNIPSRPPVRAPLSREQSKSDDSEESHKISPKVSALPPPPPKPRAKASTPPAVPPARTSSVISNTKTDQELDLELNSEWFTKEDIPNHLPKCFQNKDYSYSYGKTNGNNFVTIVVRDSDLSTVKAKLVWKDSERVHDTLEVKQSRIPPPVATRDQLSEGASKFCEHVASWCESKEGKKVGDGECWTLARDALKISCGKFAFISSGYIHGALLSTFTGLGVGKEPKIVRANPTDDIKRGDIIQYTSASFRYPNKALFFGEPHHTSIVLGVNGFELTIAHQNVNGQKVVSKDTIDISKLAEGELKFFRPVSATWIKDLDDL